MIDGNETKRGEWQEQVLRMTGIRVCLGLVGKMHKDKWDSQSKRYRLNTAMGSKSRHPCNSKRKDAIEQTVVANKKESVNANLLVIRYLTRTDKCRIVEKR